MGFSLSEKGKTNPEKVSKNETRIVDDFNDGRVCRASLRMSRTLIQISSEVTKFVVQKNFNWR